MLHDVKRVIRHIDRPFFERLGCTNPGEVRKEIGDLLTESNALPSLFRRRDSIVRDFEDLAKQSSEAQVFEPWMGQ